jgi:hypothetical protein
MDVRENERLEHREFSDQTLLFLGSEERAAASSKEVMPAPRARECGAYRVELGGGFTRSGNDIQAKAIEELPRS